ncbi:MAG: RusA family crossover junction endodeoxyribonuclease [Chloroflexaceae bacterium]|nr:RusA family crossover junction endodeoxyribonuclease [Chloroflexaceae bacterium]
MLPFEFIVAGPPVSHQTRHATRLRAWQQTVRSAAEQRWPAGTPPLTQHLKLMVTYYHDGVMVRMDNDNMVKPIQDALNGLVYVDDRQITDTYVRKTDLNGSFRVRGMSPVLAEGFCRGNESLHVRIDAAPDHEELPS